MKTWVKLYTEIVGDAKIGRLSWAERGMWMMLMALAGQIDHRDEDDNETGQLGTPEDVAWHLRCSLDEFDPAIETFTRLDMIHEVDGVLVITHYSERQDALTDAERARQHRRNIGRREYYGNAPTPSRPCHEPVTNRDGESESESETDSEKIDAADAATPPETAPRKKREPKPPAPPAVQTLHDVTGRWPATAWYECVDSAVGRDPPNLERWKNLVLQWLGCGWYAGNVKGMLQCFERNEMPGERKNNDGSHQRGGNSTQGTHTGRLTGHTQLPPDMAEQLKRYE